MAEIKPMALIESMKKKVCEHSDVYFRTNKQTGKVTTGKLCNPSTKEPSAAQTAAKAKAQHTYGSLFGYAMHKLNDQYDENGDLIDD